MKKAIIVTGATGSMGAAAVRALASKGITVVMACRNIEKALAIRSEITGKDSSACIYPLRIDLSRLSSIREFVNDVTSLAARDGFELAGLFNNAGVINRRYGLSDDGIERTLATNYVGPYLLTRLLLPYLSDGAHIVNMVSLTCRLASVRKDFFSRPIKKFRQLGTYADTKLALLLFSTKLAERLASDERHIHVNVADPGVVNSNMLSMGRWFDPLADVLFRPLCKSPEDGVRPALRALEYDGNAMYFKGESQKPIARRYHRHKLINWLWQQTASLCSLPD